MKKIRCLAGLLLIASFSACSSSSSDGSGSMDYNGTWDVRYNFDTDQCQVVTPPIQGFVDQHQIDQTDGFVTLLSISQFPAEGEGSVSADGSFVATETTVGDVFGDGTTCTLASTVSYSDLVADTANSIFTLRISCNDGFECASEGIGIANRQVLG